jgi:hypothetical protein
VWDSWYGREECHNEFDLYKMSLLFDPFDSTYRIFCLDQGFEKYAVLHNKTIEVNMSIPPYNRLLAWRARQCVQNNAYLLADQGNSLLNFANFSNNSRSETSETAGKGGDSDG